MKAFILILLLALPFAARAEGVSPKSFDGYYDLIKDHLGMCEPTLFVTRFDDTATPSIAAGGWFFPRVNAGTVVFEDSVARDVTNAYTTADSRLILDSDEHNKAEAWHVKRHVELSLHNGIVHVRSTTHDPSMYGMPNSVIDCTYKVDPNPPNI